MANKTDLVRQVSKEEGQATAKRWGCAYFETCAHSATCHDDISECFEVLISDIQHIYAHVPLLDTIGEIDRQGYLGKVGNTFKSINRRYFSLKDCTLSYSNEIAQPIKVCSSFLSIFSSSILLFFFSCSSSPFPSSFPLLAFSLLLLSSSCSLYPAPLSLSPSSFCMIPSILLSLSPFFFPPFLSFNRLYTGFAFLDGKRVNGNRERREDQGRLPVQRERRGTQVRALREQRSRTRFVDG